MLVDRGVVEAKLKFPDPLAVPEPIVVEVVISNIVMGAFASAPLPATSTMPDELKHAMVRTGACKNTSTLIASENSLIHPSLVCVTMIA